jgi:hypothetical protein
LVYSSTPRCISVKSQRKCGIRTVSYGQPTSKKSQSSREPENRLRLERLDRRLAALYKQSARLQKNIQIIQRERSSVLRELHEG